MGLDEYVVLLLHCNGDDESPIISDSSIANPKGNATVSGNAQIDTAQYVFGGASLLFDDIADYIYFVDSVDWCFGTGDFTIDFRIRFDSFPTQYNIIIEQWLPTDFAWNLYYDSVTEELTFAYSVNGTDVLSKSVSWTAIINTWYHIAIVRNENNLMFFIQGIQQGLTQDITGIDIYDSSQPLKISEGINNFNGWIDEVRISKGIARWTENFTPPAEEYNLNELYMPKIIII